MEPVLVVLLICLFGGLMLVLALGLRLSRERKAPPNEVPVVPAEPVTAPPAEADETVLRRVRDHIAEEQVAADAFVAKPSVESLYRTAPPETRRDP